MKWKVRPKLYQRQPHPNNAPSTSTEMETTKEITSIKTTHETIVHSTVTNLETTQQITIPSTSKDTEITTESKE